MTEGDRVKAIIDSTGLSIREFSKRIGLKSPQTLYNIVKGRHGLSEQVINQIQSFDLNLNKIWIMTGEGDMYLNKSIDHQNRNIEEDNISVSSVFSLLKDNQERFDEQRKIMLEQQNELLSQQRDLVDVIKEQMELVKNASQINNTTARLDEDAGCADASSF